MSSGLAIPMLAHLAGLVRFDVRLANGMQWAEHIRRVNRRDLHVFVAVAEHGNISNRFSVSSVMSFSKSAG